MAYSIQVLDSDSVKINQLNDCYKLTQEESIFFDFEIFTDAQEKFSHLCLTYDDKKLLSFLFCSFDRIGGTPSIILGFSATKTLPNSEEIIQAFLDTLTSKAKISFPDEDILITARVIDASAYSLLNNYREAFPQAKMKLSGEDKARGKRISKWYSMENTYTEEKSIVTASEPQPVTFGSSFSAESSDAKKIIENIKTNKDCLIVYSWVF
jgi:hypothetical protein